MMKEILDLKKKIDLRQTFTGDIDNIIISSLLIHVIFQYKNLGK